ncbi:MAG: hypothetical protein HQM08_19200 [Candidatus Riflebacteria bacterium]|nr:hypothetical protein [Candidatus Riflebacteria bacterium]
MFTWENFSTAEMYAAFTRRDWFYDHLFYQGVTTTGIYCRTDCPAKLPLLKNARFFFSSKEAAENGYRACKRCQPDRNSSFRSISISKPKNFDLKPLFDFYSVRAVAGIEDVSLDGYYARSLPVNGKQVVISVHRASNNEEIVVRFWGEVETPLVTKIVARKLDFDAPRTNIKQALGADPLLGQVVSQNSWISLPSCFDPFEGVVRIIVGQLISMKAARTLLARIVERFGTRLSKCVGSVSHVFPSADIFANQKINELMSVGLTSAKAGAIRNVAKLVCDGKLDFQKLEMERPEIADRTLQAIPGIGPWSAALIRMEVLGDRNAFPSRDLGVMKSITGLTGKENPTSELLEKLHRSWSPWGAYATLYLWQHLDSMEKTRQERSV